MVRWFGPLLAVCVLASTLRAAEPAARPFDISAGTAEQALKAFSAQSGQEVLFATATTSKVRTNPVKGTYSPPEALDQLLKGTGLVATRDPTSGTLSITRDPNASRAAQAVASSVRPEKPARNYSASDEAAVVLSPFEVVSDTKGYYATNTMSGTRFNSKLEDLGSALAIITKEQMADFAMIDINDIFLYAANTEGTGTYTEFSIDRNGSVDDAVMTDPRNANRVRGIGRANVSLGNFETSGRVPIDPIGIDAVEISRGPNANVFGLGNAAGTVNQVPAAANLTRNKSQVGLRADSFDGWRTSLDVNRVLKPGVLSARVGIVRQHEGYNLKPSGTDTQRYSGMVKFQPFKSTTLSAAYSSYLNKGNRPNTNTPRDNVSYWVANGRPTWDPVTQQIHRNGVTIGTFPTNTGLPDFFSYVYGGYGQLLSQFFIDRGGIAYVSPNQTNAGTSPNITNTSGQPVRLLSSNFAPIRTNQPLFSTTPAVGDKSLYDWSSINYAAANYFSDNTETASVTIDQFFFNTPTQTLVGQFAWLREDSEAYQKFMLGRPGNSTSTGYLQVDVNERLLDGSPNPYFLRPFIAQAEPITYRRPLRWDTYRAQLAYKLDLTGQKGMLRWLGRHQLSGYAEYKDRYARSYAYRDVIVSNHTWLPYGTPDRGLNTANTNMARANWRFYLGDNQGQNVDYASSRYYTGNYTLVWGNGVTGAFTREPITLGEAGVGNQSGDARNIHTILKDQGAVLQSHFLNGRIVTTFGLRSDDIYTRFGTPTAFLADAITFDYGVMNHFRDDWARNSGRTKQGGVVIKPWRDTAFAARLQRGSGLARFLGETLQGLALTYNRSDSFIPVSPAQNLFGEQLGNPTGTGTDYGFALTNLFGGKLVVRLNHYDNRQVGARDSSSTAVSVRALRYDVGNPDANFTLYTQATAWISAGNPSLTADQVKNEVARIMGFTVTDLDNYRNQTQPLADTQDTIARGYELEININPTPHWTLQGSATKAEAISSNLGASTARWIAQRMPVWTSIIDPRTNTPWWTTSYGGTQTAAFNYSGFLQTPLQIARAQDGKSTPSLSKYSARVSTNFRLAGLTEQRILKRLNIGGALRYQSPSAIGYYGKQQYPAVITELDPNNPIWDKAHVYLDAFIGYRTKLWADKIGATFQFNVRNLQEGGRLQAISAYPDGTPNNYRIVDPRQFILSATFDL